MKTHAQSCPLLIGLWRMQKMKYKKYGLHQKYLMTILPLSALYHASKLNNSKCEESFITVCNVQ